jgi:hypothetical protein
MRKTNVSWNNREAPTPLVGSSDSTFFDKNLSLSNKASYMLKAILKNKILFVHIQGKCDSFCLVNHN